MLKALLAVSSPWVAVGVFLGSRGCFGGTAEPFFTSVVLGSVHFEEQAGAPCKSCSFSDLAQVTLLILL